LPARLKVLVVDDDQLTLEMLGMMLAAEDVEVLGLRDPREASALIEKERFDGIFLDLTMPGLNGVELAGRIRASHHNSTTPIVVITGRGDSGAAMKEAFSAGAHFFLAKPLDRQKLRHLLKSTRGSLLRERRSNRRVPLTVDICCCAGTRTFNGMTSQISEQTVVFHLNDTLQLGEAVYVAFRLPASSRAVEGMGTIVPTDDVGSTACQFKKLDDVAREAVRVYVASVADAS
jgi:DNA-binding response OmpR family regulator